MIISRTSFTKVFTSILSFSLDLRVTPNDTTNPIAFEKKYHSPPFGVTYETNPTVFGRILDGSIPSTTLLETDSTIAIRDKHPKAALHALIIPKRYIKSINTLNRNDLELLKEMKEEAIQTLQFYQSDAYDNEDYLLCFHIPPFISVEHLHMHVLAPASEMKAQYRYGKYLTGTIWCAKVDDVLDQLLL